MVNKRRLKKNLQKSFGITFIILVLVVGFSIAGIVGMKTMADKNFKASITSSSETKPSTYHPKIFLIQSGILVSSAKRKEIFPAAISTKIIPKENILIFIKKTEIIHL